MLDLWTCGLVLAMLNKNLFCLALLFFVSTFALSPCRADDFPGKGDRFAWSNALPYYNLANKYLGHGRYEEAKTNFEEAIYRYEYDPDFFINYGVALRKLENYTAAEEAFKKAIELRNNDWQAWSNLANAYLKQNRLKDTIACFQKAMKMNPPPPRAEKEAMLKDIADINKILSMQAPPPDQAKHTGSGASEPGLSKVGRGKKTGGKSSGSSGSAVLNSGETQPGTVPPGTPPARQDLKKSGWDWVQ